MQVLLAWVSPHPGNAAFRSMQTTAGPAKARDPRHATITVVRDAALLAIALRSNVSHIRMAAHVDLRQYVSSAPEAGVIFEAGSRLESLTVRESDPQNDMYTLSSAGFGSLTASVRMEGRARKTAICRHC